MSDDFERAMRKPLRNLDKAIDEALAVFREHAATAHPDSLASVMRDIRLSVAGVLAAISPKAAEHLAAYHRLRRVDTREWTDDEVIAYDAMLDGELDLAIRAGLGA